MTSPLVTVFIPLYNCEVYIRETLESIINQTYSNLEILIVDDGSTDDSIEIVKSYKDSRIRLLQNGENKGIPFARNVGLDEAKGKYLAIMDSDDIAYLNRIKKQVNYMEENHHIDAIGSYYKMFGSRINKSVKPTFILPEEIKAGLLFSCPIGNPTSLVRLETIKRNNISYNLDCFVAQDYDFWVQVAKVGNLAIVPEVLLKYRTGHLNITKKTTTSKYVKRKKVIDSIHEDMLNFYDFHFTEEEIGIYNEFFNENPQDTISESTIAGIKKVIDKMLEQNRQEQHFDEQVLLKVMGKSIVTFLSNHKLGLGRRINLYNKLCVSSSVGDLNYLVIKHMYRALQ